MALFTCAATAIPTRIQAQTNTPAHVLPANRYLLIIETSHAMQRRSDGTLRVVNALIGSRMRGQLRLNDTIGVWTFNETLYAGKLALQDWSEGERSAIAGKLAEFLQDQKYEKQARLDKVVPALLQVVKKSEFITVILITEGSQDFHGTPFDQQINQLYKQWSAQQQKAHMPLVTVLRARRGQFTNYSVTPAPWPVEMPPLPSELVTPKTPPSPAVASVPKPTPPPMAQPLILSGRKPRPVVAAPTNASIVTQGQGAVTNLEPGPPASQVKQTDVTANPATPLTAPDHIPGANAADRSLASSSSTVMQPLTADATPNPAATPPSSAAQANESKTLSDVSPTNLAVSKSDQTEVPRPVPTAEIAAVPAVPASSHTKVVAFAAVVAAAAAAAGFWFWKRRTRPAPHISLITRSLDREKH